MFDKPNGAFTGEISAEQLKDSGISWTLTGHSERRVILGEDDSVSEYLEEMVESIALEPEADLSDTCELVRCPQDENRARGRPRSYPLRGRNPRGMHAWRLRVKRPETDKTALATREQQDH